MYESPTLLTTSQDGETALILATIFGNDKAVKALLDAGAEKDAKNKVSNDAQGRMGESKGGWGRSPSLRTRV